MLCGAENTVKTIIFGDIHGCNIAMRLLLEQIQPKQEKDKVAFIGDLLDWGPDSRDVLRTVQELSEAYQDKFVLLPGNHEDYLTSAQADAMLSLAIIFSECTMANLQTVSIITEFPIGIVMILIIVSFIISAKNYMKEQKGSEK